MTHEQAERTADQLARTLNAGGNVFVALQILGLDPDEVYPEEECELDGDDNSRIDLVWIDETHYALYRSGTDNRRDPPDPWRVQITRPPKEED